MPSTPNSPSPTMDKPSDFAQLVSRIRDGDERALERLLAIIAPPMRRIAAAYVGPALRSHVDADDLVQRAALILWHGLRSGKFEVSSPQHLLNLTRTLLKRQAARAVQKYQSAMNAMAATGEFNLGATMVEQSIMPAPSPAKKAETSEQIQNLMMRVNPDDRRMLELLLQGHTIAAAARELGIEPAALRMRLSRLRVRVRRVHRVRVEVKRVRRDDGVLTKGDVAPPVPSDHYPARIEASFGPKKSR